MSEANIKVDATAGFAAAPHLDGKRAMRGPPTSWVAVGKLESGSGRFARA